MTPLQLRLKYKSETGLPPTNGTVYSLWGKPCNYKGTLRQSYAEWIEDGKTEKRIRYKLDTGENPTFVKDGRYGLKTWFTAEYAQWLEESYCDITTILEKDNIPYL